MYLPDINPTLPRGFHMLTVSDVNKETDEATSIAFDVPENMNGDYTFIQGQYLTLMREIEGERIRRPYSICVAPNEGELRICSKKQAGGRMSTFLNENLKVGDTIAVMKPMGRFHMEIVPNASRFYVAIVGGSGITPVISIIYTVLQQEPNARFLLIYGNKTLASTIFRERISDAKNRYMERLQVVNVLSREPSDIALFNGRLTTEKVSELVKAFTDPKSIDGYYICGPEDMMVGAKTALDGLGIPDECIKMESFGVQKKLVKTKVSSTEHENGNATKATIIIGGESSHIEIPAGGKVLDAAMATGIDAPNSCRSGVCATCKARLIEGKVKMAVNYALDDAEVEQGYILTCQARPVSKSVIIDYDAL